MILDQSDGLDILRIVYGFLLDAKYVSNIVDVDERNCELFAELVIHVDRLLFLGSFITVKTGIVIGFMRGKDFSGHHCLKRLGH